MTVTAPATSSSSTEASTVGIWHEATIAAICKDIGVLTERHFQNPAIFAQVLAVEKDLEGLILNPGPTSTLALMDLSARVRGLY